MKKAQAFATFKILIGAVFATALLVMVYMIVATISYPISGFESTKTIIIQAYRAPGLCFARENVLFAEGEEFTEQGLKEAIGVALQSVTVQKKAPNMEEISDGHYKVESDLNIPVSATCDAFGDCEVYFYSTDCSP